MPLRRRARKKIKPAHFKAYIPEHSELEKTNQRDIALLEQGWSPEQTKFGEPFKGKNKVLIVEDEK